MWALHLPASPLTTWRPLGRLRGLAWPPTTCPRHLRLAWAMRGLATWPQCRVASARVLFATSALRAMSARGPAEINPAFCAILIIKIKLKSDKNPKKSKNSKLMKYNSFLVQIFSIGSQMSTSLILCHLKYNFKEEYRMNKNNIKAFIKI